MKAQVADVFLQKFQLKPEEIQVLRGAKSGTMSQVWNDTMVTRLTYSAIYDCRFCCIILDFHLSHEI